MSYVSKPIKSCAVIGEGKLGTALFDLFVRHRIESVIIGRDTASQVEACKKADLIILAVNDTNIADCAASIASSLNESQILTHCSGSLGSEILSVNDSSAMLASTHPLNTFPSKAAALQVFANGNHQTPMVIEGNPLALPALKAFYQLLGFNTLEIKAEAKPLYHAACVFACNYLSSIMFISEQLAERAGLEPHELMRLVAPLVDSTLTNIRRDGSADALSGPVARGDLSTVASHLSALDKSLPKALDSYQALGLIALEIANNRSLLQADLADQMASLLNKKR